MNGVSDSVLCLIFLGGLLGIACVTDLCSRRIPNWLNLSGALVGLVFHFYSGSFRGLLFSAGGILAGAGLMIFFYALGGMGAGDVKLMAAVGGFLGARGVVSAFVYVAIIGGIYALILLILHRGIGKTLKRYLSVLKMFALGQKITYIPPPSSGDILPLQGGRTPHPGPAAKVRLNYGVAIALGTFAWLFGGKI